MFTYKPFFFLLLQDTARRRQGAIIESMHNHGKGVYSGTFSGKYLSRIFENNE